MPEDTYTKVESANQKSFCMEKNYNIKNEIAYSTTFDDRSQNLRTVKRFQNKNFVMVSFSISYNERLSLKFIDKDLKKPC